eukprot:2114962-Rhodomonas_salina.2
MEAVLTFKLAGAGLFGVPWGRSGGTRYRTTHTHAIALRTPTLSDYAQARYRAMHTHALGLGTCAGCSVLTCANVRSQECDAYVARMRTYEVRSRSTSRNSRT